MVSLAYLNLWDRTLNEIQDNWLFNFIKYNICDVKEVQIDENPDIIICSCFGDINNIINYKSKIKIFFYGENLNRFNYDINIIKENCDLILGFKKTDIDNKQIRLPLWVLYYPYYIYDNNNNLLNHIENSYLRNLAKKKNNDTSIIARHDENGIRTIIYDEVVKYSNIKSPGKFKKNMRKIGPSCNDKFNFIRTTAYNICPENSEFEGYCTEKIFQAFEAGCIPIYWGIDKPEKYIINENYYYFVNKNNIQDIKDLFTNKNKYIAKNNLFKDTANETLKKTYDDLKDNLIKLFKEKNLL